MDDLENIKLFVELFREYGWTVILGLVVKYVYTRFDKIDHYLKLLFKLIALKNKENRVRKSDITNHNYFDDLTALLKRSTITVYDNKTEYKMYVADVITYVNHYMFNLYLSDYLKLGRYSDLGNDLTDILGEVSKASTQAVSELLNEEVAQVYDKATRMFRSLYFDMIHSITGNDKITDLQKVYLLLDILNYRLNHSHNILYKIFLDMNGQIEGQIDKVEPKTKEDIINYFNKTDDNNA